MTYRWDDHSMRANLPRYRPEAEEAQKRLGDPLEGLRARALAAGLSQHDCASIEAEAVAEIEDAICQARAAPEPDMDTARTLALAPPQQALPEPEAGSRTLTYASAITEAIAQEMDRDSTVIVLGEDIGAIGGIFGLTRGLSDRFVPARVRDTPISEGAIAGCAVGAALSGMRLIAEIQLFDFVTLMMDGTVNQAAKARFMLGGPRKCRSCSGGRRARASGLPRSIPSRWKASS